MEVHRPGRSRLRDDVGAVETSGSRHDVGHVVEVGPGVDDDEGITP
jgi:hypothetical protein